MEVDSLVTAMEARERDVMLLHRAGVQPYDHGGEVVLYGPLLCPLPRLEWSGWDSIHAAVDPGAEALLATAAALPSFRRLVVNALFKRAITEAFAEAVAMLLLHYPVKDLHFHVGSSTAATVNVAAQVTAAWLLRPCATSLDWMGVHQGSEAILGTALAASPSLQRLEVVSYGMMCAAPLLAALERHPRLEEVTLETQRGAVEEELCMRLVDLPALRCLKLRNLGRSGARIRLEVEAAGLPALEALQLKECDLVEVKSLIASLGT